MNDNSPNPPVADQPSQRLSWREGFRMYLRDPHAKTFWRFALTKWKFLLAFPFATDLLVPVLGPLAPLAVADNALFWPLLAAAVFKAHRKIEHYRDNPQASDVPPRQTLS